MIQWLALLGIAVDPTLTYLGVAFKGYSVGSSLKTVQ